MKLISRCGFRPNDLLGCGCRAILAAAASDLGLGAVILCVSNPTSLGDDFGG